MDGKISQQWTNLYYDQTVVAKEYLNNNDGYEARVYFALPITFPNACWYMENQFVIGATWDNKHLHDTPYLGVDDRSQWFQYVDDYGVPRVSFMAETAGGMHTGFYVGY